MPILENVSKEQPWEMDRVYPGLFTQEMTPLYLRVEYEAEIDYDDIAEDIADAEAEGNPYELPVPLTPLSGPYGHCTAVYRRYSS